jgi:hypothetical protein
VTTDMYDSFTEKKADEIKTTNKGLIKVVLLFCIIFNIALPSVMGLDNEDATIMRLILFGLVVFLYGAYSIITSFRVRKLKKGSKIVMLSTDVAYVGGEFHCWNIPGYWLSDVKYSSKDTLNNVPLAFIEIKYSTITMTGPMDYTVIIPVPEFAEKQAVEAIEVLQARID